MWRTPLNMCTCLLTLVAEPTVNGLTRHSIIPVYIFQPGVEDLNLDTLLKEVLDCVWELESEEFKNIYRSEVGLFMLYPRGGPRGSRVNIKKGIGDQPVRCGLSAGAHPAEASSWLEHLCDFPSWIREWEMVCCCCPFILKRQAMCQNQSEITVYV